MLSITSRFLFAKIAIVTHLRINLGTCECLKIFWDRSCGYSKAVRMDSKGYFGQRWLQAMSGLSHKTIIV